MEVCQQGLEMGREEPRAPSDFPAMVPTGVSGCVAQVGGDDHLEVGEQGWVAGLEGCACSWLHTGELPSSLLPFSLSSSILQLADGRSPGPALPL